LGPVFMFCALGLFYGGNVGVGSRFHVLRSRTRFRRYRRRRVPFGGAEGVVSSFHVLRSETHFRRYRGRPVPFSCFARTDAFSSLPRASGPVLLFCTPGLIFGGAEGVVSRFNVFCSLTHFRRYRGRRIPFSCLAGTNSFSAWPRAWGLVFMFCAPGLVYSVTECVRSRCGRRVPFSCFAVPDSSSAVSRTWGPIFIFCAPGLVFSGAEGVGSRFHVLLSRTNF
jgi:hypothetical protein